jgi:hypothetical protein
VSSPAKAGDPVFQRLALEPRGRGVLDSPPSRGMTGKLSNSVARMSAMTSGADARPTLAVPHLASLMRATNCVPARCGETQTHPSGCSGVMVKQGRQKYRSDDRINVSHVKTRTSLTTVAARFAMIRVSRGSRTEFLASVLFLAVAAGATIVKADEGGRDARCGRCLQWAA